MDSYRNYSKDTASSSSSDELVRLRKLVKRLAESNKLLASQVETDLLTGLFNRRGLERMLRRESRIAERQGHKISCALIDLDDFKRVNESYGHAIGDAVLKAVAQKLMSSVRSSDYVSRIGGDEFLIVMPDTEAEAAVKVLRRCTVSVAQSPLLTSAGPVMMTISSGVCSSTELPLSLELVLMQTRFALKNSKLSGKNQVSAEHFSPVTDCNNGIPHLLQGNTLAPSSTDHMQDPFVR